MEKSKLIELKERFPMTEVWMDSFVESDIQYGLLHGNLGITTSPVETAKMIRDELPIWKNRILKFIEDNPNASEREIFWMWNYEVAAERCLTQMPFYKEDGDSGRFGIQANIYDYMNAENMIAQAKKIKTVGPNTFIKIPTTKPGLFAMEESVANGCSVMATSCLTVSQMIAAAEALERGYDRRKKAGLDCRGISISCAMQLKMQDDLFREYAKKKNIEMDQEPLHWGAIAVAKKAYQIFKKRGYRARMVTSYFDSVDQFTYFIGGDIIMTLHRAWQEKIEESDIVIKSNIDTPVKEEYIDTLQKNIPLFAVAYDEKSLTPDEFHKFPVVRRYLHWFLNSYDEGVKVIREIMLPWELF